MKPADHGRTTSGAGALISACQGVVGGECRVGWFRQTFRLALRLTAERGSASGRPVRARLSILGIAVGAMDEVSCLVDREFAGSAAAVAGACGRRSHGHEIAQLRESASGLNVRELSIDRVGRVEYAVVPIDKYFTRARQAVERPATHRR